MSQREAAKIIGVHPSNVQRHFKNHLRAPIKELMTQEDGKTALNVTNLLSDQYQIVQTHLQRAIRGGKIHEIAMMLKEGRKHIELSARLSGQINGPANQFNLLVNPEFVQLKQLILDNLDPVDRVKLSERLLEVAEIVDEEIIEL